MCTTLRASLLMWFCCLLRQQPPNSRAWSTICFCSAKRRTLWPSSKRSSRRLSEKPGQEKSSVEQCSRGFVTEKRTRTARTSATSCLPKTTSRNPFREKPTCHEVTMRVMQQKLSEIAWPRCMSSIRVNVLISVGSVHSHGVMPSEPQNSPIAAIRNRPNKCLESVVLGGSDVRVGHLRIRKAQDFPRCGKIVQRRNPYPNWGNI